jgi:hypothetical protein
MKSYTIASGVLNLTMIANEGCYPEGSSYSVRYTPDRGSAYTRYWVVPASPTTTTVSAIETGVVATPSLGLSGPASSTDNAVARWNLTSGRILQNSIATVNDSGLGAFPGGVSSGDGTVAGSISLVELAANGNDFFSIKAPDSRSTSLTLVYPDTDPLDDQVISCSAPSGGVSTCTWTSGGGGGGDAYLGASNTWTAANNFAAATIILPTVASGPSTSAGNISYNSTTKFMCVSDGTACRYYVTAGQQQTIGSKNLLLTVYHTDSTDETKKIAFTPTTQATATTTTFQTYSSTNRTIHFPDASFVVPHTLTCTGGASAEEVNSAATSVQFGNTCTIPAGHLVTGVVIEVTVGYNIVTPASSVGGMQLCLRAGSTSLYCMAANQVMTANLSDRGGYGRFIIEGTAAAGASAPVNVAGMLFMPGLAAVSLDNALGSYSVSVDTTAAITLNVVVTWAGTVDSNTMITQTHMRAFQHN